MAEVLAWSMPVPRTAHIEPPSSFLSPTTASHDERSPATALSTAVIAQRPLLTRKDTLGAGGGTSGGGMAATAGCRLLWRGKVMSEDGLPLHGVAFIAHLFTVSSSFSPSLASSSVSPFDDPFSSSTTSRASGADLCLGLEMLRGAAITVKGEVRVRRKGDAPVAERKLPSSGGKKGKGKLKEEEVQTTEVETPTDVRVYIDERCPETVDWFEDKFCREGNEGCGIKLDAGGEEVILFAAYPDTPANQKNVDPTASTSTALTQNLFAKRLRKSASLPAPVPAEPTTHTKKPRRQSAKDKAIASLLGAKGAVPPLRKARASSSQPPNIAFPPPVAPASRAFGRSTSYQRLPSVGSTRELALGRQSSLPPISAASARRGSIAAPSARALQRTASRSSMLLDSPPGSDDEGALLLDPCRARHASRAPSPTPSVASAFGDLDDEGDFVGEGMDAVAELRSFGTAGARKERSAGTARELSRSSSLPVGQFALGRGVGDEKVSMKASQEREGTALPSATEGEGAQTGSGAVETRNKNTVKKLALNRMTAVGCGKRHPEFRDVFSFTTRGVAFAMRATFKVAALSPTDRERASDLIEQHLRLYLPTSFFASSTASLGLSAPADKVERVESTSPPSPKSLGDALDDSLVHASVLDSQDVDMAETRVDMEDAETVEDTRAVEEDEENADEVVLVSVAGVNPTGSSGLPPVVSLQG
ncbi:hypothetical protein Rt10032_c01g0553 [Rhodotorula toruloides]|uniref:Sld7 C-terminal domain-containing protein n=1 Tax=Rhodotorula toruloides TaxID=5286 RepID=A0A511K987_RHOTO|nr:hypothetical protein Rt10032_c01g0553 [Rhodotorula toruloides]